jgi:uncharacterized protein
MPLLIACFCGLLFGLGLIASGMTDPGKVLGFLDLAGPWDPSLALVMVGAIGVGAVGFWRARQQARSWLNLPMQLPNNTVIDRRLVLGSLTFGAGWGLAGYCPGPAVVAISTWQNEALIFGGAMLGGMALFSWLERRQGA